MRNVNEEGRHDKASVSGNVAFCVKKKKTFLAMINRVTVMIFWWNKRTNDLFIYFFFFEAKIICFNIMFDYPKSVGNKSGKFNHLTI